MTKAQVEARISEQETEKKRLEAETKIAQNTFQSFSRLGRKLTKDEIDGQNAAALELRRLYHMLAGVEMELGTWYMVLAGMQF